VEEEEEEDDDEDAPLLLLLLPPPAKLILPPLPLLLLFLAIAIVEKLPKLGAVTSAKASADADTINRVALKFIATLVSAIYYTHRILCFTSWSNSCELDRSNSELIVTCSD
jgi:hypothetical protein